MIDFSHTPVNRELGLELIRVGDSENPGAEVQISDCSKLTQEGDIVHGGILTTLADTAAVYAIMPDLPEGKHMTSIEFKMNFFRPGRANHGPITARSKLIKRGRKINVCEADVYQGESHLAKGTFTYLAYDE
ncbi:MAG: PaaI family thioesterase [Planctomycetes bacterium]|nr:PaaI family thioesterase [Planctomycetota bacterium]MCP4772078.1 PaaI family thioesterase [Planctomycetota bacterium]MCP4860795.1 PaaI family thioesterase [Planctomycetota bacterium]